MRWVLSPAIVMVILQSGLAGVEEDAAAALALATSHKAKAKTADCTCGDSCPCTPCECDVDGNYEWKPCNDDRQAALYYDGAYLGAYWYVGQSKGFYSYRDGFWERSKLPVRCPKVPKRTKAAPASYAQPVFMSSFSGGCSRGG